MKQQWKRLCPGCRKEMIYSFYGSFLRATKKNSSCIKCNHNTLEYKTKSSLSRNGIPNLTARKRPFESRYNTLVRNSKDRGINCSLTYEDYLKFIDVKTCQYCGSPIKWEPYQGRQNGNRATACNLDRKSTNDGYTVSNLCVCCWNCNTVKNNIFSYDEMMELGITIRKILEARKCNQ